MLTITTLYEFLTDPKLPKKFSKFILTINNQLRTDMDGHSIFISLNPIGFFDQNDVNYNDLKFRFRRFVSIEDMLLHLTFLIDKKYKKNNYCDMQLDFYEKQDE